MFAARLAGFGARIINSALKVRISRRIPRGALQRPRGSRPRCSSGQRLLARLRSRVAVSSGSWAMLSETSLQPDHQRFDALQHGIEVFGKTNRVLALLPTGRPAREIAAMMRRVVPVWRRSLQHAPRHEDAAADAEHERNQQRPCAALATMPNSRRRSSRSRPISRRSRC